MEHVTRQVRTEIDVPVGRIIETFTLQRVLTSNWVAAPLHRYRNTAQRLKFNTVFINVTYVADVKPTNALVTQTRYTTNSRAHFSRWCARARVCIYFHFLVA